MKHPSNIRASRVESISRDQDHKPKLKSVRHDPRPDPPAPHSTPILKDLDSLNDEQLRKLTQANTKKNHGGRSSRIRSQVERVFRRLDNLAADVKLQSRYSIDALPVINPDGGSHVPEREGLQGTEPKNQNKNDDNLKENVVKLNSKGNESETEERSPAESVSHEPEHLLDALQDCNNDFDIEPATHTSGFTDSTASINTTSSRSVRISTSVTVLDYIPLCPVSIARLNRYEHPTRTGKCLQTRKLIADHMDFPFITIMKQDDLQGGTNEKKENTERRRRHTAESVTGVRESPSPPPPRRVHSARSATVECVATTSTGAYGSRVNKG